jgi:molybdopterin/thiamine biosynthesis adenylyltransferase
MLTQSSVDRHALMSGDDRYARQRLIAWWDQERVANARVLVIGAGALGNEILKLLALTGIGRTLVVDLDRVELSNLSRSVLFRDGDDGRFKAELAAARMHDLNPEARALGRAENVVTQLGLGVFHWADVVIAGVDNREARVFVNAACARVGRAWVDGAIEGLSGVVRAFEPATSACYECTMNETDRRLLAARRSCAMLARREIARGHVPSTAVAASLIASLEVQEAVKLLHGQPALVGEGLHVHGLFADFSRVRYPRREDCAGHDRFAAIEPLGLGIADVTVGALLDRAEERLGLGACLDLSRDIIVRMVCPACGDARAGNAVLGAVTEQEAGCPSCGTHRTIEVASSITREGGVDLSRTLADLGLPAFDAVLARRGLDESCAWLFDGDAPKVLGSLFQPDGGGS